MFSDNASTYVTAVEDLQEIFEPNTLKETLEHQNIAWNFIPKYVLLQYGEFWKHLIGLTNY